METIKKNYRSVAEVIQYLIKSKKEVQEESKKRFQSKEVQKALNDLKAVKL